MPHVRNAGKFGRPTYNQAAKVIARLGGESAVAKLLQLSRPTIYKWQYRRPYGSDGLIPSAQVDRIKRVARIMGVLITEKDWLPERITYEDIENDESN